jgi:hypothetical protein
MSREWRMSSDTPYLVCDGCGKAHNMTDRDAADAGWSISDGTDYCQECVA